MSINDFDIQGFAGEGAYAKVVIAKYKLNNKIYAIKII